MRKKIILDLDTGIDDTLALVYILGSPDAELIGITATYGNVVIEQGISNDLRLLELFGRSDIPVYQGISHPSDAPSYEVPESSEIFHAKNGTGNIEIPAKATTSVQEKSAVDFIIESARTYSKDELVYVPTGPSTNLDAAFAKAPDIVDKIKVVMMGGSLTQPGNCNMFMEANISQDPHASNRVFRTTADITMIGLDVTMQALMTKKETEALRSLGTATGKFLADMTDYYIDISEEVDPAFAGGCNLHDPLAAAVALDPSLVTCFPIDLMVETEGPGRGRTIGNPEKLLSQPKNTKVALAVDAERFTRRFFQRLKAFVATCQ